MTPPDPPTGTAGPGDDAADVPGLADRLQATAQVAVVPAGDLAAVHERVALRARRRRTRAVAGLGIAAALVVTVGMGAVAARDDDGDRVLVDAPVTTEGPVTTTADTTEVEDPTTAPPTTGGVSTTLPATTVTPPEPTEPPTTPPPATTATTTATTTTVPSWPPALSSLSHGGPAWGVYLATSFASDDPVLDAAEAAVAAVGYRAGTGSLGCDQGAHEALGLPEDPPGTSRYAVAIYFGNEDDARRFIDLYDGDVLGYGLVHTYCLD